MEELLFSINEKLILVYMSVTILSVVFLRSFNSFLYTCFIITSFEGFMSHIQETLLHTARGNAVPPELPEHPFVWYGTWVVLDLIALIMVRYGHRMIKETVSPLAVVYMFCLLGLMLLQIIGYVDSVMFQKTVFVSWIYAVGINVIALTTVIVMLWQFAVQLRRVRLQWKF